MERSSLHSRKTPDGPSWYGVRSHKKAEHIAAGSLRREGIPVVRLMTEFFSLQPVLNCIRAAGVCLLCLSAIPVTSHGQPRDATGITLLGQDFIPGQVLVQFKRNSTAPERQEALDRAGLRIRRHIHTAAMQRQGHPGVFVTDTLMDVMQAVTAVLQHAAVDLAEPNWVYRHQGISNDPYFTGGQLWGLYGDTGSPSNRFGAHASKAWAQGVIGSRSVYVGVIDEGMQWQHSDLAANVWTNAFEVAGDGLDNDGNGYADDMHGWNFYSDNGSIYSLPSDQHGTHVAGTIGAEGGNGQGVAGVNWRVTLVSGKFLGPDGGSVSDAITAIDYFTDLKLRHGLNIVALNNSWGGGFYSQPLHDAILRAAKADILFVAAAGNGLPLLGLGFNNDLLAHYPSSYDTSSGTSTEAAASYNAVIAVAAIDETGALASFSNYGSRSVHLGAPGVDIFSTLPTDTYGAFSGTSMATPHVTGAIALFASRQPSHSASEIREALLSAVTPTTSLRDITTTGGRLNVATLLARISSRSRLKAPVMNGDAFRFTLEGVTNQLYGIEVSRDLTNWTPVGTITNGAGSVEFSDPISRDWPRRFYRTFVR